MPSINARVRGGTLVEVLVTVLVISLGLLGMARLQTAALIHAHDAWLQSEAVRLSARLFDQMRANRGAALAGCYNHPDGGCNASQASPEAMHRARRELQQWLETVDTRLPAASAHINSRQTSVFIELRWHERGEHDGGERRLRTGTRP